MDRRLVCVVGLAVALLLAAASAWALKPGEKAPDFTCDAVAGQPFSAAELSGKVAAVCFWASWSKGAAEELQYLQSLLKDSKGRNLTVVAINQREDRAKVNAFATKRQLTLRMLLDDGRVARAFDANGLPNLIILDGAGVVRARFVGYGPTVGERIRKAVVPLLSDPKAAKPDKPAAAASPDLPVSLRSYAYLQLGAAHINIGDAFINAGYSDGGHYAEAVTELRSGLTMDPRNVDLLVWLGVALERRGDKTEATRQFQAALALDPASSYAREGLRRLKGLPPTPPPAPPAAPEKGE